jgi:hypothetical protein
MSVLFVVLVIIVFAAAAGAVFYVQRNPYPTLPERKHADPLPEEEWIPVELYGLYCCIRKGEDGLMTNTVFRFSDNAGKDDNGAVLSVVIGQRKPGDGYFPKEKWFGREGRDENETQSGGRWKRNGNRIRFVIELPRGNIIYKGVIQKDCMILDSYSEITGHKAEGRIYKLYPFEEVPGWWD